MTISPSTGRAGDPEYGNGPAGFGVWEIDTATGQASSCSAASPLFGFTALPHAGPLDLWLDCLEPADCEQLRQAISAATPANPQIHLKVRLRAGRALRISGPVAFRDPHPPRAVLAVAALEGADARRAVEQAIRDRESRYRYVLRATREIIWDWDVAAHRIEWSPEAVTLFGDEAAEVTDDHWMLERIHPEDLPRVIRIPRDKIASAETWAAEYRVRTASGDYAEVLDRSFIVRDENGRAIRVIGAIQDVTAQNRTLRRLRESEERLALAQRAANVGVFDWDLRAGTAHWNAEMEGIYGLLPGSFDGNPDAWKRFVHPEDLPATEALVRAWLESGAEERSYRYRFYRQGQIRWIEARGRVYRDGDGRAVRLTGINIDITDRMRAEEALRESEERFRAAVESFPHGFVLYDSDRRFVYLNRWAQETIGRTPAEVAGKRDEDIHPEALTSAYVPFLKRAIETRTTQTFEWTLPREFRGLTLIVTYVPHVDASGAVAQVLAITYDITERKRAEEALRESELRLRAANQDLEQFAFSVSHDLREPLRTISIYSELLRASLPRELSSEAAMFLSTIETNSIRMAELVRDLLAYTRASDEPLFPEEQTSCADALGRARDALGSGLLEAGGTIEAGGLPWVRMRASHMDQLLQNLIGNAIKYRREPAPPRIRVSAARQGRAWRIEVSDNGIGIDPAHREQIFGLFKRLHPRDRFGGTGIGLALCKKIVERYGGEIWAEEADGGGSRFCFTIPD
ncbi:MAG: PAS domain S-box protein [Bryobacteraceae bacterium]|nr:PAS domain S-box protein [Bryobacteraceae bacterium]